MSYRYSQLQLARVYNSNRKRENPSLLRRCFNTAKIKAREAFIHICGEKPLPSNRRRIWRRTGGGGGVIQTIFEEYDTENDI